MNSKIHELSDTLRAYGLSLSFNSFIKMMLSVKFAVKNSNGNETEAISIVRKQNMNLDHYIKDDTIYCKTYNLLKDIDVFELFKCIEQICPVRDIGLQTPPAIHDWFMNAIVKSDNNTVLIPEAEHYLYDLREIATENLQKNFTIGTSNEALEELLKLVYEKNPNVKVISLNIYNDIELSEKFDIITSIPDFGGRNMVEEGKNICRKLDFVATENLLKMLSPVGKLLIVLPARITFEGGKTLILRSYIEKNYGITEIRELPVGIFTRTGIRTYYFEFSASKTENTLISTYESIMDKATDELKVCCTSSRMVTREELCEQQDWQIRRLLSSESELLQSFYNSPINKVKLKEVAEIFRGKAVNSKTDDGNIAVINISNISETGIDYENLETFEEEERKVKRYELQDGDVLLTCRGTTIKTATFERQNRICIPSVSLVVIRPKKDLQSRFLEIFFQTPIGKAIFESISSGTTAIQIKHTDIMEITIPLPPPERQNEIVKFYENEKEIYLSSIKAAEDRWNESQNDFLNKIY